jgi:hypothetical protein
MIDSLLVTFIFLGHSGMDGTYCQAPSMSPIENVQYYIGPNKGFIQNPADADYIPKGMVYPFMKEMVLRYPDKRFAAAKYSKVTFNWCDMKPGEPRYDRMKEGILDLKKRGCIIGGVVAYFGFDEASERGLAENYTKEALRVIDDVRATVENPELSVFLIRYESNHGIEHDTPKYWNFQALITEAILDLSKMDRYTKVVPVRPVPAKYFCDDHHPDTIGNRIIAQDMATTIQENFLDRWNFSTPAPSGK